MKIFRVTSISFLLISLISISVSAQTEKTEKEMKALLCHKWKVTAVQMDSVRVPAEKFKDKPMYLIFKADGTFIDSTMDFKEDRNSKWVYDHATKTVKADGDIMNIEKLTETELVISGKSEESVMKLYLKRAD